jgi:hypothetical protein
MSVHARTSDPATSHEAAASVDESSLPARRRAVLNLLRQYGPMSDTLLLARYDVAAEAGDVPTQTDSGIRTRRSELVGLGLVQDTGNRWWTPSNRRSIVWGAVE